MAEHAKDHGLNPNDGFDASKVKGKSVVITGGASGLGEEMVREFVKAGAFVTIGDVSKENGDRIVSELGDSHTAFSQCDVTTWSDQVTLFKTAIAASPNKAVDIVVANAGVAGQDRVWENDAEGDADPTEPDLKTLNINLIGVIYTAKLALHYLSRNTEGSDRCFIMTASIAGYLDQVGPSQYCASKWGVRGLLHALRRTMPQTGIRVNILAPWFIRTNIMSKEIQDKVEAHGAQFADKSDAAAAALHISSDRSINGRSIGIVTRDVVPQGYLDLQVDGNAEDDGASDMRSLLTNAVYQMGTK